jgi:hypothetical protein
MNRVASKLYLPGHPGNYPIHNPNTHFVTSSDHAKLVIQPFHQHPARGRLDRGKREIHLHRPAEDLNSP